MSGRPGGAQAVAESVVLLKLWAHRSTFKHLSEENRIFCFSPLSLRRGMMQPEQTHATNGRNSA